MKNCKFFSRIICIIVLIFLFSFNCFATSISDFAPIDSLIDNDFSNNSEIVLNASPSLLSLSSPNFPNFDPKKIPWNEQPDYIQDVVYMGMDNANFGSSATYDSIKVPFIMIRNTGTECSIFVGVNLALGVHTTSHALRLCAHPNFINANNSFCYSATFNSSTYSQKTEWQRRVFSAWGDRGVMTYTAATTLTTATGVYDFYLYGGNAIRPENATLTSYNIYESGANTVSIVNNTPSGFQSGTFVYQPANYESTYFSYFQPPSASQIEAETQKGIWESIKSIPDLIADKLKGLFVPDDGFFSEYFNNLQTFFSEKLGFLVYPFDFIITFLNKYMDIGEGDGILHLPNFDIMDVKIFNEVDFNLKESMSSFLGEYYNIYFAFVDFIILIGLVNLALKKFNSMSGGNDE